MTLVEVIKMLCLNTGDTLASLEKKLGFGNATIRKWNSAVPSGDRLSKVADYFNVSVDYLLGRENSEKYIGLGDVYFNFAKEAEKNEIDPEDIKLAIDTIKRLRKK